MDKVDDCKEKKSVDFEPSIPCLIKFFSVLKLTWNIEKVIKAMQKHHGNYYSLGRGMNLNHNKKTTQQ